LAPPTRRGRSSSRKNSGMDNLCSRDSNLASTTLALLQSSILIFANNINERNLYLSLHKCKFVLFTLRPYNPIIAKVHFNDHYFDSWLSSFQYLGIILDSKASWKPHISHFRSRAFSAGDVLKSLSPSRWTGVLVTLLLFYKSFGRSIMDFPSPTS